MTKRLIRSLLFVALTLAPLAAQAQRRSPLADAPAVRHRVELRATRFELGAGLGSTINQTFNHGILANVRAGFHLNDWLSLSGTGAFNVASLQTGFANELYDALAAPADPPLMRDPSLADVKSPINKMNWLLGLQAEVTPFAGKFSVFGKLFAHYDVYAFGGAAFVNLAAANSGAADPCSDEAAQNGSCLVSGVKPGATFGLGMHWYFNHVIGVNLELRNLHFKDNPAGRDVNGDTSTDNNDLTWSPHMVAFFNIIAMLPANAAISD